MCSAENPAPERNSGLKGTWTDAIFKSLAWKQTLNEKSGNTIKQNHQ
jgi:hypothetical protein